MPVSTGKERAEGFTLIELVIGLIVFSIAMSFIMATLVPQASRSVDPILQVRAAELAQSILNEISGRSFDENSDRSGGMIRCHEDADMANGIEQDEWCSLLPLGNDGEANRDAFNDVDDYIVNNVGVVDFLNTAQQPMTVSARNMYAGYRLTINVFYDSNRDGQEDDDEAPADNYPDIAPTFKYIQVRITTPTNDEFVFGTYKGNY